MTNFKKDEVFQICEQLIQNDWQALSHLYHVAPLGEKPVDWLKTVFENSRFQCFVYHNEILIGAGRMLADGLDCAYLCDLAVHPNYQGQGVGKRIVNYLVKCSEGHRKVILYAVPGMESFYRRCGFHSMTTAMARFSDYDKALCNGLLHAEEQGEAD